MIQRRKWLDMGFVALFWLLLFSLIPISFNIGWPIEFWYRQWFFAFMLILFYYLNTRVFIPRFLESNKFFLYGLIVVLSLIVIMVSVVIFERLVELPRLLHELFNPEEPFDRNHKPRRFDYAGFILILFNFSIGIIVYLIGKGREQAEIRKELEKLQVTTELSYLKAQINPHFFFNTLNNIYALTSLDVEAARNAIHKLSSMMRYVIYDGQKTETTVGEEIKFIDNYIALMKMRLSKRVTVTFEKASSGNDLPIAPMLLLPFVENAFKHGVSSTRETTILIRIQIRERQLTFHVENNVVPRQHEDDDASGIGIANTRRRLELLYPGRHSFIILEEEDTFIVDLKLDLL